MGVRSVATGISFDRSWTRRGKIALSPKVARLSTSCWIAKVRSAPGASWPRSTKAKPSSEAVASLWRESWYTDRERAGASMVRAIASDVSGVVPWFVAATDNDNGRFGPFHTDCDTSRRLAAGAAGVD